jgi:hypothetical protein
MSDHQCQVEDAELEVPCGVKPIDEAIADEVAKCFGAWFAQFKRKNADYGNSVAEVPILLKDGNPVDAILVRMSDKIARLKNLLGGQEAQVQAETIEDTMGDLAVYCALYCAVKRLKDQYVTLQITLTRQPLEATHGQPGAEEAEGESPARGYDGPGSDSGADPDHPVALQSSRPRTRKDKRGPRKKAAKRPERASRRRDAGSRK